MGPGRALREPSESPPGFCYESMIVWKSAEMVQKISSFVETVQALGGYKFIGVGGGLNNPPNF